jgi:dipeptidyl aminopeptidase/acylaminoacyl peptidase
MPLSLRRKLVTPEEVTILNEEDSLPVHAQIFKPEGEGPLQPLLWLHGGPMAQYSYDCNPLLSWLASCGYLVMAPNFSGSTGNGLAFMNRVLAEGCGVADLSDCLACARYLRHDLAAGEPRLDLSRGVAVGGHSWGGYLAYLCMLEKRPDGESVFGCGIAAAGITDWSLQQRHTEVRYYDHALLGGWVYEPRVAARAREASPLTRAAELRAPLLVLHGKDDIDVPFRQIPPFVEAAGRSPQHGASVEHHYYEGEGHGMSGTQAQADYLDRIKTFLRINLKPWDFTDNPHGEVTAY